MLPNATCNPGLVCATDVCAPPDNGTDAAGGCTDDSAYEPNDVTGYRTGVAQDTLTRAIDASICPGFQDQDLYAITTTTANQGLHVSVAWLGGAQLQLTVLNSSGATIGTGTTGTPGMMTATQTLLPVGNYTVRITSGAGTANYTLNLSVTNP